MICPRCGETMPPVDTTLCRACMTEVEAAMETFVRKRKGTEEEAQERFLFPYLSTAQKNAIRQSWEGQR